MPCTIESLTHREKVPDADWCLPACVARPVPKSEVREKPKAQEAMRKEWQRLWEKDVFGAYSPADICEWSEVAAEARKLGKECHMGIVFGIMVEKNSQLQNIDGKPHPDKKYKYRVVFQGNRVINQDWESAIFMDGSSKPVAMETAAAKVPKITGAPGRQSCVKAIPASASARICVTVPAVVTGDIAPARINGETTVA